MPGKVYKGQKIGATSRIWATPSWHKRKPKK